MKLFYNIIKTSFLGQRKCFYMLSSAMLVVFGTLAFFIAGRIVKGDRQTMLVDALST